jgi:D-alanine-D-alanine ligase
LVVKPSSHGSAIGVTRLDEDTSLELVARALEAAWALDEFAVVEHFARGREVTCGVLHLDTASALPPTEILSHKDSFYTYTARYTPGRSTHVCPAQFSTHVVRRVQEVAVAAHEALGCRDLSRVDFVVGDDDDPDAITVLEVNTLPGMTATSLYPEAAAVYGFSMPRLCDVLAVHARIRGPARRHEAVPLPQ